MLAISDMYTCANNIDYISVVCLGKLLLLQILHFAALNS